jgi:hypothetical protein
MILSREVWADATGRFAEDPFNPEPHREYKPTPFGPPCIAITGDQQQYMDFIGCLVWVQFASTPVLALQEMRFLMDRTRVWPAPHTTDPEVVVWYLPSVRVTQEEVAA